MWNKLVLLFFMFGCWLKYLDYPANIMFYNVWFVLVLAWIILNALAMLAALFGKMPYTPISEKTKILWITHNLIATLSFWFCGQTYLTLAFLTTSVVFMFIVLLNEPRKKKRK